jgi:8-oxo-dGTP pyrophosphatase MutT (NUDIX family)
MVITASSIIIRERKILLAQRTPTAPLFPSCWTFPGGKAEEGETPEETAVRETKEETNLNFVPKKLFRTSHYQDRLMYRYLGEWSGDIRLQEDELSDFGWFTFTESIDLAFAFDYRLMVSLIYEEGLID